MKELLPFSVPRPVPGGRRASSDTARRPGGSLFMQGPGASGALLRRPNGYIAVKHSVALWPPNPSELLRHAFTFAPRAAFGT